MVSTHVKNISVKWDHVSGGENKLITLLRVIPTMTCWVEVVR